MADIVWTDEKRNLSDLMPWDRNPRQITHAQAERLVDSVELFGQVETLAIGPENELYNGHQRLAVLMQEYGDMEVDVRVASRPLTEHEREKLTVYLHKGAAGSWDFDILADQFEVDDLLDWGFEPFELGMGDEEANDIDDEWVGMPEFEHEDLTPESSIIIHFDTNKDRLALSKLIQQTITDDTKSLWYPAAKITTYANKSYSVNSDEE